MEVYRADEPKPLYRVLDEEGSPVGPVPDLAEDRLVGMYRGMVLARTFDERALNLQRQGRIGTYAPFSGQEAAQIGSFAVLEKDDWVFPSYRELAGLIYHGLPMERALLYSMGHPDGAKVPEDSRMFPVQIVIASQLLHAVGAGWACRLKGERSVAVSYFGDGATSEGDFHEALNLASVFSVPVVFFCQNNGWAISVPVSHQMRSATVAQRAVAYGIEGIRVDGNDVLAVYEGMLRAVDRARAGEGPTLVEAVTYRLGPHTTADDPTRYRDEEELKRWREQRDPIVRFRKFLEKRGIWSEEQERTEWERARRMVDEAVVRAESYPKADPSFAFEHVYALMTPDLSNQRDEWRARASRREGMQ
ncbi:pyruvate dehydrogenase (acetyl-transferring) E1 component subunit alpha [Kyrpidia spormannii]|uniref:Pyruvate dehydrogenase E1 component subunit alpha n=1 Tax=Kyrpidia spormannii TaxID=2055160 RepID=A0A2K8N6S6_9BACL|nr:pyruvate dehydrogenase (acetyl-transferring) E1 component subunit alpha [Kyrpidia spormannii]ATY84300.1 pyruvate dehydrogenase (acetyl-transferring) E1 component subunit alpha [Kyrpidia spormannii]